MSALKILEAERQSLYLIVQNLYDLSRAIDTTEKRSEFLIRIRTLDRTREEFVQIVRKINEANFELDPEYSPSFKQLQTIDELYCYIKYAEESIAEIPKMEKLNCKPKFKLPTLSLVSFNGDFRRWPLFHQSFKETIHENEQLSDAEKIQYLTSQLTGAAANMISGILPVASNYKVIWDLLIDRFQDPRTLATQYLNQILSFKKITVGDTKNLDSFTEHFETAVTAFRTLGIADLTDFILTHVALSKLDKDTVSAFEQYSRREKVPKFDSLSKFVKEQAKIFQRTQNMSISNYAPRSSKTHVLVSSNNSKLISCPAGCVDNAHPLHSCPKFKAMDPSARLKLVNTRKLCWNCLRTYESGKCKSKFTCFKCGKKHHTLIHMENKKLDADSKQAENTCLAAACRDSEPCYVGPTARVNIQSARGKETMRVLLDTGSSSNFVTETFCKKARLKVSYQPSAVYGIGETKQKIIGFTSVQFSSRLDARHRYDIRAAVVERITGKLPTLKLKQDSLEWLRGVELADEQYHEPNEVDGLLGAGLFPHLLRSNRLTSPNAKLVAVETTLGYVLMGEAAGRSTTAKDFRVLLTSDERLEQSLQNFWALEAVQSKECFSPEESKCEEHFEKNTYRGPDGRYTVSLPFKEDPSTLGDSYRSAKRRFLALERKLDADTNLREGYDNTIREYIDKGFLAKVDNTRAMATAYYIPHRAVYRPEKETSKIRIVLDASCKTSSGKSLNDVLHCGPNLQSKIFQLLLNFRLFEIAISADIEKMFFSIKVAHDHRRFQRILYRFQGGGPIETFEFGRVPFGLKVSPYLAMRIVKRLACDEGMNYPDAALVSSKFNYMDDYLLSEPSLEKALTLRKQLIDMFASAGFNLTKWISNSREFLSGTPDAARDTRSMDLDSDTETKLVGLWWNPSNDEFSFKVRDADMSRTRTKRSILSNTAELYDPLGILTPLTAGMKLLVQDCWKRGLTWDEEVPADIEKIWVQIQEELCLISKIRIPRHIGVKETSIVSLLGFADASEKCYGAVIYVRVGALSGDAEGASFLCAKSRVAPLKKVTLARLELCAAHLLALLMQSVMNNFNARHKVDNVFAFSDSMVTLAWIHSSPHRWHTFIANRVTAIHEAVAQEYWHYVPGKENPSDLISRPVSPGRLVANQDWFKGPSWVLQPREQWPGTHFSKAHLPKNVPEEKAAALVQVMPPEVHPLYALADRVSRWDKLLKATVFVLRFIKKLSSTGPPSVLDLDAAEDFVIGCVQRTHFEQELKEVRSGKTCSSSVKKLNPFLERGILRVGGRLSNAALTHDQKHQILLPAKDRVTQLIVEHHHKANFHAGPGLLLAIMRQRYWVLAARNLIRKVVHACNACFRCRPRVVNPLMGDLPSVRVTQVKPFERCGVDYAGPVFVTLTRRRGQRSQKAYICLFVCLSTKAVHIELVSDLSTEMFLAAFKRFLARRGPVSLILSDGGKNFVGARRRLGEIYTLINTEEFNREIIQELTPRRIEFKINPPYSPHFGGLWETNIKSVKTHLYRVLGKQILTYEELNTLLVQIEALLNSRPLCVLSNDPSDPEALTPSHFLNLTPLKNIPVENLEQVPLGRVQRYALIDRLIQSYWRRWHAEYLSSLQTREKWNSVSNPVSKGQVVILKEPNLPTLCWPLAIIEETYPGKDDIVRVVKVKTKGGSYVRPIVRVFPLPSQ